MTVHSRDELKSLAAEQLKISAEELVEKIQGRYVFYMSAKSTDKPVGWMSFYGTFQDATIAEARRMLQEKIPEAKVELPKHRLLRRYFSIFFLTNPDLLARLD